MNKNFDEKEIESYVYKEPINYLGKSYRDDWKRHRITFEVLFISDYFISYDCNSITKKVDDVLQTISKEYVNKCNAYLYDKNNIDGFTGKPLSPERIKEILQPDVDYTYNMLRYCFDEVMCSFITFYLTDYKKKVVKDIEKISVEIFKEIMSRTEYDNIRVIDVMKIADEYMKELEGELKL